MNTKQPSPIETLKAKLREKADMHERAAAQLREHTGTVCIPKAYGEDKPDLYDNLLNCNCRLAANRLDDPKQHSRAILPLVYMAAQKGNVRESFGLVQKLSEHGDPLLQRLYQWCLDGDINTFILFSAEPNS